MGYFQTKKDYRKLFRTIFQFIVVILLLAILLKALITFKEYSPYVDRNVKSATNNGFIAISYLGVDRNGTSSLIGTQKLNKELTTLRKNGYVTITQKDILNYYEKNKSLPEKSLFLMFEDGRRDTAIFAQDSLEKNNYIGTILTYADKFENDEHKFLLPKDLMSLKKQTFWEMGTNGYRLSYINVYDRYDHFLGNLSSLEYNAVKRYLGRNYNQYLMDFIRDENDIPLESTSQMTKRIQYDYELMNKAYTDGVGEVPALYVLMHANTGSFGNNDKVSAVNEACINKNFKMNFNREGFSYNINESSIYDLTRMQVQAYWYTNHLLMRIHDDTEQNIDFVDGDLSKKDNWDTIRGASEFDEDKIIITSLSEKNGIIKLKDSESYENFRLNTDLSGNKLGIQSIYLRADDDCKNAVEVALDSNILYLRELSGGSKKEIAELNLDMLDGIEYASVEENRKEALVEEYKTKAKYAKNVGNSYETAKKKAEEAEKIVVKSVKEGAEEYIPDIQIGELAKRHLEIIMDGNTITVNVDGKCAFDKKPISREQGNVFLEAAFAGYGYSQRNISDDVYDGVFEKLEVTTIPVNNQYTVLYTDRLTGIELFWKDLQRTWNSVVDWFINTF